MFVWSRYLAELATTIGTNKHQSILDNLRYAPKGHEKDVESADQTALERRPFWRELKESDIRGQGLDGRDGCSFWLIQRCAIVPLIEQRCCLGRLHSVDVGAETPGLTGSAKRTFSRPQAATKSPVDQQKGRKDA